MIRPAALALLVLYWSSNAQAQAPDSFSDSRSPETVETASPADAAEKALVRSALTAFERRDYATAVGLFKRACVGSPNPTLRLYLARSRVALRQFVAAADDYRSVVSSADPEQTNAALREATASARDELAQLRPRIPSIEIALGDAEQRSRNLRLVMDGRMILPNTQVAVDPGHHEVLASDIDGEQSRVGFDILEGEAKTVGMAWRSAAGHVKKQEQLLGGSSTRRNWGVVALTVGATGLGVGTVTGIAALSRYSAAEAHCPANRCTQGAPYPEDASAFRTLRTISATGYIVGAAGIGTWLGLLLTTPTSSPEHPKVSPWTPVVGMGSAGARYVF